MLYRNIKTGAERIFGSVITAPDWIPVEKKAEPMAPKEAPQPEPPKAEPKKEDPPKEDPPKKAPAKKSTSAPKKRTKK